MTPIDRFERQLPAALTELADPRSPDYVVDILGLTARTRQRPAWASIERWLPMDLVSERAPIARVPWRRLGVVALLALLGATLLAAYIGSHNQRLPAPFGPAANGVIAYGVNGDIVVRDTLSSGERTVVGGPTDDHDPGFSPDGTRLLFIRTEGASQSLMAAKVDGTDAVKLFSEPMVDTHLAWRFDSRAFAIVNSPRGMPRLSIVDADGSSVRMIELPGIVPSDIAWRPPEGRELLVRGQSTDTREIDFYIVDVDAKPTPTVRALGLDPHHNFGPDWDNSAPTWMLDGSAIAYNVVEHASNGLPDRFRIHVVDADGSNDRELPGPPGKINEAWPFLSPDGRSILVQHFIWDDQPDAALWLAVLPADGSGPAHDIGPRLTHDTVPYDRGWSPDGTRVLAKAGSMGMVSIDPLGGTFTKLDWGGVPLGDWQRLAP